MKVIIAGSRSIIQKYWITKAVRLFLNEQQKTKEDISEVVSGNANGVDKLGEDWANAFNKPIKIFKPDWNKFGKTAGILRNIEMGDYADALIAIWDGKSKGTKHMISYMELLQKPVFVLQFLGKEDV